MNHITINNASSKFKDFWSAKRVFITGNTGFKGAWLSQWLIQLGANVFGYSLERKGSTELFDILELYKKTKTVFGDIRNSISLRESIQEFCPDIILHLAAQSLVRYSYDNPLETYETNVLGTAYLLEAVRLLKLSNLHSVVIVTTDKCYENKEWDWGYRENDPLGGYDPYSSSKAACEIVTAAYRSSYFNPNKIADHKTAVASARAGNVIGGGDWSLDRLIPDIMRSLSENKEVLVRNPYAIRPWQHVLEPLFGYLQLAQKLYEQGGEVCAQAYNFGPQSESNKNVMWIVQNLCQFLGKKAPNWCIQEQDAATHRQPHEAQFLKLDISKAFNHLGWEPRMSVTKALEKTASWYDQYFQGKNMIDFTNQQIAEYEELLQEKK